MSGVDLDGGPNAAVSRGNRISLLSHRWFLPAAAFTSAFLGLLLLFRPVALVGYYVPIALFAIGIGVLAASTSLRPREVSAPPPQSAPMTVENAARPSLPAPRPGAAAGPPRRRPDALVGRGSEWRIPSESAQRGNGWGLSWLTRRGAWRTHAGGSDSGTGVVHSPGRAGTLVALPMRHYYPGVRSPIAPEEYDDVVDALRSLPSVPPTHAPSLFSSPTTAGPGGPHGPSQDERVFSEEELDRMFPLTSDRVSPFLLDAPQRVGGSSIRTRPTDPPATAPRVGTGASTPARDWASIPARTTSSPPPPISAHRTVYRSPEVSESGAFARPPSRVVSPPPNGSTAEITHEATNPVPPHLRASGPLVRYETRSSGHPSRVAAAFRSVCASCSKIVLDLRMSGPCPKCLRPVCQDCLREALVTHGRGWCVDCSAPAPRPVGAY